MTPEEASKLNLESAHDNGNELAFPHNTDYIQHSGMSKREWMSAQILIGLLSNGTNRSTIDFVDIAVDLADRLLVALNSKQ
jgi:hypothetical protein